MRPYLLSIHHAAEPAHPLDGPCRIGRGPECDLRLELEGVSREHCLVSRSGEGWEVCDLESRNGTFVNGERVERYPLVQGDVISAGAARLRFELRPEAPAGHQLDRLWDGRYRVKGRIARGGMAELYHAWSEAHGCDVAIKLMSAAPQGLERSMTQRFLREVRALEKVSHPGVVRILDSGVTRLRGTVVPYCVMEYLPGRTLHDLHCREPFAPRRALGIVSRLCEIVAHVHREGLIHRDLKPSNVMLGDGDRPVLIDFGLVKLTDPGPLGHSTPMALGSLEYMPPEQLEAARPDERTDVYGLGGILFHLLTGRTPHSLPVVEGGIDAALQLDAIAAAVRERPSLDPGRGHLDAELSAMWARALDPDPRRRHPGPAALSAGIEDYLARHDGAPLHSLWLDAPAEQAGRPFSGSELLIGGGAQCEIRLPATESSVLWKLRRHRGDYIARPAGEEGDDRLLKHLDALEAGGTRLIYRRDAE